MSYKNRGMFAEEVVNQTIQFYRNQKIALIHKKMINVVFNSVTKKANQKIAIKKGWIKQKSTVDYYGIYQSKFLAFEVKSINSLTFPLINIKDHQWKYLELINFHQGHAFLLIYFAPVEKFILINFKKLLAIKSKSLTFEKAKTIGEEMPIIFPEIVDFLKVIDI